MYNNPIGTPLSLKEFADTLELHGGFLPSITNNERFFMKKYIDNLEVVALMGIFISSLIAITPIS